MSESKISVIMLTYNREKLVSCAIESILLQTYKNFEFIVVDNGSSDDSGKIADEYAEKDNRIRVIHREWGNIGSGRNTGLDAADKAFDEKKIMSPEEALIELMWRKKYNMDFPTKLFSRKLADTLRFPEEGSYDDIALMYRLLAEANRIAYHGLPKYTFYRHEGNNSAWTTNHRLIDASTLDEYLHAYRTRTEWLSEKFLGSADIFQYFEWSFMISMVEKIHRLHLQGCGKQLEHMTRELKSHKKKFLNSPEILEYEKKWLIQIYSQRGRLMA